MLLGCCNVVPVSIVQRWFLDLRMDFGSIFGRGLRLSRLTFSKTKTKTKTKTRYGEKLFSETEENIFFCVLGEGAVSITRRQVKKTFQDTRQARHTGREGAGRLQTAQRSRL